MKLKDICIIQSGGTPSRSKKEYWENGTIPWVKISDFSAKHIINTQESITEQGMNCSSAKLFPKGTLLYTIFATIGEVGILDIDATTNQAIVGIMIRNSMVDQEYLYYYLMSLKDYVNRIGRGVAQNNINMSILRELEIPLPPIEKQKKISNIFIQLDKMIEQRQNQIDLIDELVKSRFIELFGDIDRKINIGSLCDVTGGYSFKSKDIISEGNVKLLQIGNVYLDNISWKNVNYLPKGYDKKYPKFLLSEGDILIALTRPIIQSLGNVKACIVKQSDLPCMLNQRVGRIVAKNDEIVDLKYIYGCLMTDKFTKYVEECSIGCSQPNISTKDIENYRIPDVSYDKQVEYVRFKTQTDKSKYYNFTSYKYCVVAANLIRQEWMLCQTLSF